MLRQFARYVCLLRSLRIMWVMRVTLHKHHFPSRYAVVQACRQHLRHDSKLLYASDATLLHSQAKYVDANLLLPAIPAAGSNDAVDVAAPVVEQFVSAPLPRPAGLPLVDDWNCLRVRAQEPWLVPPKELAGTATMHVWCPLAVCMPLLIGLSFFK